MALLQNKETNHFGMSTVLDTTLWFESKDARMREKLIATGQLTVCYSLIKRVKRLQTLSADHAADDNLSQLLTTLRADWEQFKQNPGFMIGV